VKESGLGLPSIGEGPTLDSEELGLEERLRDRRAVYVNEGSSGPNACLVNRSREEPFACTGLTQEKEDR
jgi:hypothetical protein